MLFSRQQLVVNPSELRILRRERKYFHPKTSRVVIETSNYANLDSNHQLRSHHRHLENRNFRIKIDVFSSEKVCYWAVWRAEIQFAVHFWRILLHFYLLNAPKWFSKSSKFRFSKRLRYQPVAQKFDSMPFQRRFTGLVFGWAFLLGFLGCSWNFSLSKISNFRFQELWSEKLIQTPNRIRFWLFCFDLFFGGFFLSNLF